MIAQADDITKQWIRNAADERAAANGCRFNPERAAFGIWWIEKHCRLYEGEWAGQPLMLRGLISAWPREPIMDEWEAGGREASVKRVHEHAAGIARSEDTDWQFDTIARMLGWERWSEKWDRWVRRFTDGSVWVAKKNKKSPTMAALGLYLTCGDGVQGQKVFVGGVDGKQVRENVGKHAIMMVKKSPELDAVCTINQSLKRITHNPTESYFQPMSSANERTEKSKEGQNGSLLVDECHVVNRSYMNRVSRMGISRVEPLTMKFSTAGDDQDGYGKEQWDYGHQVNNATPGSENDRYFFACYAAPQDLSDADLEADPIKYAKMANPAWGHTIDPEEYLADYNQSKRTPDDLATFKKYRLNIWQHGVTIWLPSGAWSACKRDYNEAELSGLACCIGMDLSRVRDMSSIVAVFPMDNDEYKLLPFFWLPEEYARTNSKLAPFMNWEAAGHLKLCTSQGGRTIDFNDIKAEILRLSDTYYIEEIRYDPKFANELAMSLEETGIATTENLQNPDGICAPFCDMERLILEGKLHHDGHPVLEWQMNHCGIKTLGGSGNRRVPVKEKKASHKKIDGVIATVMGLSGAMVMDGGKSYTQSTGWGNVDTWT